jgi:RNA polymerase sigma factor (sigma-70 family)
MKVKPSRRVPEEAAATLADITAAIEALTPAHWAKLRQFARTRAFRLGPKTDGRTGDDLIQTALTDLLQDTRRWNKDKVGFLKFMTGAMRSISSNWARSYNREETAFLEADLCRENEDGETFSPLEAIQDQTPDPAKRFRDNQTLNLIESMFKDDQEAQMVITAWQEGYDPAGVRELWGLSQTEYNTIVRRVRRRLNAAGLTAGDDPGGKS